MAYRDRFHARSRERCQSPHTNSGEGLVEWRHATTHALEPHLRVGELERHYRAAREPHERSWYQILWLLAKGQTAREIAASTGYSPYWIGQIASMALGAHDMSLSTPAETIPFHLVGYTWGSGRLELLWRAWLAEDASVRSARAAEAAGETQGWAIARGAVLDLAAVRPGMPGERRCIGYRPPEGGPPRLCPQWRALPPGGRAQCEACERREGRLEVVASDGSRPPTGPRAGYLRSAHEVYLAAFSLDTLKVGVSGAGRTPLRVLEQGAPAALIVGRADDGMAARRLEHHLGLLGARERVLVRTKRRLLYPPPEADRLLAALGEALATMAARLPHGWPPDVQRLDPPLALDNTAALGLDALTGEPDAAAVPPAGALCGRVAAAAGALLIVEQPQASLWGEAEPLAAEAHDLRAWLGWRVVRAA